MLALCVVLVLSPVLLTIRPVQNCTGLPRKYINIFLPCEWQEPWTSNLPALPHLMYFNLGVIASRFVGWLDRSAHLLIDANALAKEKHIANVVCSSRWLLVPYLLTGAVFYGLSIPLLQAWGAAWGNLYTTVTVDGYNIPIKRGFKEGPNFWWLAGMLFPLYCIFSGVAILRSAVQWLKTSKHTAGDGWGSAGSWARTSAESVDYVLENCFSHLGANILLYLIVTDLILAGSYRGGQAGLAPTDIFPLTVWQGGYYVVWIFAVIRFLHYLAKSSRK